MQQHDDGEVDELEDAWPWSRGRVEGLGRPLDHRAFQPEDVVLLFLGLAASGLAASARRMRERAAGGCRSRFLRRKRARRGKRMASRRASKKMRKSEGKRKSAYASMNLLNGNPRRPPAARRAPPGGPNPRRRPESTARAAAASASSSALAWLTLSSAALRAASSAASRSAFHCFTRASRSLKTSPRAWRSLSAYSAARASACGNGLLRIFDGAFGAGAALFQAWPSAAPAPETGRPNTSTMKSRIVGTAPRKSVSSC